MKHLFGPFVFSVVKRFSFPERNLRQKLVEGGIAFSSPVTVRSIRATRTGGPGSILNRAIQRSSARVSSDSILG
ncbi:MAG: hypothetical protein MPW14_00750 [Candidatus Manganitrophus sp.]|nr:MAG: hypothetical protein MPW14_00750 [Candidatus Manganitrophus sp.]